jgi:hypothetical protein
MGLFQGGATPPIPLSSWVVVVSGVHQLRVWTLPSLVVLRFISTLFYLNTKREYHNLKKKKQDELQ